MGGKFTKYLAYVFFIGLILFFVLNSAVETQKWVPIVRLIALYTSIACGLIYVLIITYCIFENRKIDKMLNTDDYDNLIEYANKKVNKKALILENRTNYYNYLLLLCYLAKDEKEKIDEYFSKTEGQDFMFPMISYWKVCYNFANGSYDNLKENFDKFRYSKDVSRAPYKYSNLVDLLNSFVLYSEGKVKEAKEIINTFDTKNISMPATLKAINIIKETVVEEDNNENIIEE